MYLPKEPWEGGRCATSKMWDGSEQKGSAGLKWNKGDTGDQRGAIERR